MRQIAPLRDRIKEKEKEKERLSPKDNLK
jgi:hypothetical protein